MLTISQIQSIVKEDSTAQYTHTHSHTHQPNAAGKQEPPCGANNQGISLPTSQDQLRLQCMYLFQTRRLASGRCALNSLLHTPAAPHQIEMLCRSIISCRAVMQHLGVLTRLLTPPSRSTIVEPTTGPCARLTRTTLRWWGSSTNTSQVV